MEGGQTAPSNADSGRWLWPECLVEAAAEGFKLLRVGKGQPRTPIVAVGCGLTNWSKLLRMGIKPLRAGKRQA